jgi:DGQHR domain-containing protein
MTEGHQGIHRYFTGALRWGQLERMLIFPDDLGAIDPDQRMQRGVAKRRLGDLAEYLTTAGDHFFSAITLIMLPRELDREAVEYSEDVEEWDYRFDPDEPKKFPGQHKPGTLFIGDGLRLFPADGQHRAMAAIMAMNHGHPEIGKEEVPVVLVPYQGGKRVRQLFSDLNLNAKPVSRTTGYDFETRDPVVLIVKDVAERVKLFRGRVNRLSNSLGATSAQVVTLNTLVQGSTTLIRGLALSSHPELAAPEGSTRRQVKDAEEEVVKQYLAERDQEEVTDEVASAWESIIKPFSDLWEPVMAGEEHAAGKLRDQYLFPHGLGWLGLAEAAADLMVRYGDGWQSRFANAVTSLGWARSDTTWVGKATIYNDETKVYRVNNTRPAIDDLARTVVKHAR